MIGDEGGAATVAMWLDQVDRFTDNVGRSIEKVQPVCGEMGMEDTRLVPGVFVWDINSLPNDCNNTWAITETFSEPFYSHQNGYQMCLRVDMLRYDVFVYLCLMRGPFDNDLRWPFRRDVTIDIIDKGTGIVNKSKTIKFSHYPNKTCVKQPSCEKNHPIKFLFIDIDVFMKARGNIGAISIKCTVHTMSN